MQSPGKPRRLGRGLSAMMNASPATPISVSPPEDTDQIPTPQASIEPEGAPAIKMIDVDILVPSPFQPRRGFNEAELDQLAASIRRSGVMQPIVVREVGGSYELVAGERRWRAAERAGLPQIPAVVHALDDETAAEWSLVENLQRVDLNPIERARALATLIDTFGITQQEAADRVGLDRSSVANLIRVLDLEPALQHMIEEGLLGLGHGKALLGASESRRLRLAEACVREQWPVRRLEREATETPAPSAERHPSRAGPSPEVTRLETRLGEHLSTKVKIRTSGDGTRGRITVDFFTLDHFDDLMTRLGLPGDGA
jgi:ParB family chromosome partitioning protein